MPRILIIALLLAIAAPTAAQTISYTIEVEENGSPYALGTGSLDLSQVGSERALLEAFSDLDQAPFTQASWVAELLLANAAQRWRAGLPTPPGDPVITVDGAVGLNFGAAGFISVTFALDLDASVGFIKAEVFNWVPGILYEPNLPFWIDVHEELDGGGNGTQTTDGCVLINGKQVATITGTHTVTPAQNLSALPKVQTRTSALCTNLGDDAQFEGDVFVQEEQGIAVEVYFDTGQGFVLSGNGTITVDGNPDPQHTSFTGGIDLSDPQLDQYLFLVDMSWINAWLRLYRPQEVWMGTQPGGVTGTQTLDFGVSGTVEVTTFFLGGSTLQIGFDITQLNPAATNPSSSWEIHTVETFTGQAGGVLSGVGSIYYQDSVIGTTTASYTTTPAIDAESQPITMVDVWTDNSILQPGSFLSIDGRGRQDQAATASFATTIQTAAGTIGGTGTVSLTPIESNDPGSGADPTKFSVASQIVLDAPLPSRELLLGELPAISAWMRKKASLTQYPSLGGSICVGDLNLYFQPGFATSLATIDSENDLIVNETDDSNVDPLLLAILAAKSWIQVETNTSAGDGEQSVEDDDCISVCEEDENGEVICTATCEVRARMKREIYDKDGTDFFLDTTSRLLLCVQFSPDDRTIDMVGEFCLEEAKNLTATAPTTTFAMGPPYPNPTADRSVFTFRLPAAATVSLDLYDARGRRVRRIAVGSLPAGNHAVTWDGADDRGGRVGSGVYWARLSSGSDLSVRRLLVLR